MWSRRKVFLFIIFAVSVAGLTVSLLQLQERLLNRVVHTKKTKIKLPVKAPENLSKNIGKETDVDSSSSSEKHKNDAKNIHVDMENEVYEDRYDHEESSDNRMAKHKGEDKLSDRHIKFSKESDSLEKNINYDSKGDNMLREEDYVMNIPHGNTNILRDKVEDEKNSETFPTHGDEGKADSLMNVIHEAAKSVKDTDTDKKVDAKEDFEGMMGLIDQAGAFDKGTFILDTHHVRNCISGKILGTVPDRFEVEPFSSSLKPFRDRPVADKESFREIYNGRRWGTNWEGARNDNSSASGRGANVQWTQEVMAALHVIMNQMKQVLNKDKISMLDVPCGDMAWMGRFLETRDDIEYTGVDIVPEVIAKHKRDFRNTPYKFRAANILKVGFEKSYDLIFNRMMLQHLFNSDVEKFLVMASESGSKYLMTTTFPHYEANKELEINSENPGRFRTLNLEVPPFSLPPPICTQHDGPRSDFVPLHHYISLWMLPLQRVALCRDPWAMYLKGSKDLLYSCVQWGHRQP